MNFQIINNFLLFLVLIFPLSLISGPFIPDLIASILSLILIFLFFQKDYKKYFYNKQLLIFLFFYIILLISSFTSKEIFFSLSSSLFYFRFFFFAIAVWIVLDLFNLKFFFFSILIPILALFIDGSYQYIYGINLFGYEIAEQYRVSSLFFDELKMGSFVVRLLPLLISIFLLSYSNVSSFYIKLILLFLISFYLILISGERTSLIMYLMFLILSFIIIFRQQKIVSFLFISIPLIFSFLILLLDTNLFDRIIYRTFFQLNLLNNNLYLSEINIFTTHHEKIYSTALALFKDNYIIGIGPKMFRIECASLLGSQFTCSSHPHNFYLQILTETGLIGFSYFILIFLILIYLFFQTLIKTSMDNNYIKIFALFSLIVQLLPFLPSGNLFNNWLSLIMYYSLGYFLYALEKK